MQLVALACGAVGLFGLALRTDDKFWRTSYFVLAALNVVVLVIRFFT
jgi:cell division protein FtsW (lipid II flippase)